MAGPENLKENIMNFASGTKTYFQIELVLKKCLQQNIDSYQTTFKPILYQAPNPGK
jgi:hypothetical protein